MTSMLVRKVQWSSIYILFQVCFLGKNISLGKAENIEAIINVRYENKSNNYNQYIFQTDTYQSFEDYFFNKTIISISLNYTYDTNVRNITKIVADIKGQFNGAFYSCQNFPSSSSIQCNKKSSDKDSVSSVCINGTVIKWLYNDEYLISSHFQNYTFSEGTEVGLVCYSLIDNATSTPTPRTLSSTNTPTITTSSLSADVIAGVSIGIIIVIIAIVIIVVIFWKRKHNKDTKETTISNIQTTNRTNAYNEQALKQNEENINTNTHFTTTKFEGDLNINNSKDRSILINSYTEIDPDYAGIDEADNFETDIQISTTEANEDDYTYIDDNDAARNGKEISIDDDYSILDQTIADIGASVEQRNNSSRVQVPNYSNVGIEIENGLKEKKDDYSKLRERNLNFQNTYGELDEESLNEEENRSELNTDNANGNEEPGRKRNVYSKLGEKIRDFQNTYGEMDEESLNEEEECPVVEVNNTYFVLENENTYPDTINIEK